MTNRGEEPETEEGWRVIDAAVCCARSRLGDGLVSAYAIGSLAHGGFRPMVSDVDLALLTDRQPDRDAAQVVARIATDVRDAGLKLGDRLSIFHTPWVAFAHPPADARFPPIDRYDLIRYGILVHGTDERAESGAPAAGEIQGQAVESALRRVTPGQLAADLRQLKADGVTVHDATKMVLWPVRLQHVCDTGEANGNAAAVEHYLQLPAARHPTLVQDALWWRDFSSIHSPITALKRITDEIHDLHAEVFQRLSEQSDIPRRAELAQRAQQLIS